MSTDALTPQRTWLLKAVYHNMLENTRQRYITWHATFVTNLNVKKLERQQARRDMHHRLICDCRLSCSEMKLVAHNIEVDR